MFYVSCKQNNPGNLEIFSPDKKTKVRIAFDENKNLVYSIFFKSQMIISESKLGLVLKEGGELGKNLRMINNLFKNVDTTWNVIAGMTKKSRDFYNEMQLEYIEKSGAKRRLNVYFRVYNDGVAFRYELPEISEEINILSELTEFKFTKDHQTWAQLIPHFNYFYETPIKEGLLSRIYKDSVDFTPLMGGNRPQFYQMNNLIGIPFTIKVNNGPVLSITEANLRNYSGMYLMKSKDDSLGLKAVLTHQREAEDIAVTTSFPLKSPWRVIMMGENAGDLVTSNIILNLSDNLEIADPSWIQPGKSSWEWWSDKSMIKDGKRIFGKMDNETIKYYIDFASEMGFKYSLIDWQWYGNTIWYLDQPSQILTKTISEIDMPLLVEYAESKGVGLILWMHWRHVEKQIDEAFAQFEKWGVKGVKIDFVNSDDQFMVDWYWKVAKKAAKHKLLLNIHGAYKPTGIRRAYPNFITREGVMGMEWTRWTEYITPEHNVRLVFTRMLAGPMDYTPGAFDNVTKEQFNWKTNNYTTLGTRCHQLALFVVFESPLMVVCDFPGNINKGIGKEFLKEVPTSWDDVKVLDAKLAEYIVIARKKNNDWYIGGITNRTSREIQIQLGFLDEGSYEATLYEDGISVASDAKDVNFSTKKVDSTSNLTLKLAEGGGVAIKLTKLIK